MASVIGSRDLEHVTGLSPKLYQVWQDKGVLRGLTESIVTGTGDRRVFNAAEVVVLAMVRVFHGGRVAVADAVGEVEALLPLTLARLAGRVTHAMMLAVLGYGRSKVVRGVILCEPGAFAARLVQAVDTFSGELAEDGGLERIELIDLGSLIAATLARFYERARDPATGERPLLLAPTSIQPAPATIQ